MRKLLLLSVLFCAAFAHGTACPSGYSGYVQFTIPSSGWSLAADLTNWPVVVTGGAAVKQSGSGGSSLTAGGLDVVFCDAKTGGNLLVYELAPSTYSGTSGAGEWWIQVPTLSHTSSTIIYALVGKAGDTDHSCGPSGTNNCAATLWSKYDRSVLHYGTSSTLSLTDSTALATASNAGGVSAAAGQINGAASTGQGGTNNYQFNNTQYNQNSISIELWANDDCLIAGCSTHTWIIDQNGGQNGYVVFVNNTNAMEFQVQTTNFNITTWSCVCGTNTTWQHWVFQYLGGNATVAANWNIYVNGVTQTLTNRAGAITAWPATASLNALVTGAGNSHNTFFDEFRITSQILTSDWIKADYNSQNSLLAFGGSITPGGTAANPWAIVVN